MKTGLSISIAFSPDTDDAFMIEPLRTRALDWQGYEFSFVARDIQELNAEASRGIYDISALSVAAFPHVQNQYMILPIGSSIGSGYGPAVVVTAGHPAQDYAGLKDARIAVPGVYTTAYLAARVLMPNFLPVPMPFYEIAAAVKSGEVDAGILIHELQLDPSRDGLRSLENLGSAWQKRFDSVLPLGINVIRRSLSTEHRERLANLYRASVVYARQHRVATLEQVRGRATVPLNLQDAERYIAQYVNDEAVALSPKTIAAMRGIYDRGYELGLTPEVGRTSEWMQL